MLFRGENYLTTVMHAGGEAVMRKHCLVKVFQRQLKDCPWGIFIVHGTQEESMF